MLARSEYVASRTTQKALLIVDRRIEDLQPGSLCELFRMGASAVTLDVGDEVRKLWTQLVAETEEVLPWQEILSEIAANHYGSQDLTRSLGDVLYFQPGNHGYIARKIEIQPCADGRREMIPAAFAQGARHVAPSGEAIASCCAIADRIMQAMAPAAERTQTAGYRIAVQRLKYQPGVGDFERLAAMNCNSLARWSRLGFRIDQYRGELNHRLSGRWLSDFLAILMCLPAGRRLVRWLNHILDPASGDEMSGELSAVVERAHVDERYFSAMCAQNRSVRTEIFAEGRWNPIPVGLDRLTIIPGNLAAGAFGIRPVLHRVVYPTRDDRRDIDPRAGNVTLLIGAT
jgi:hypothetical protein